MRIVADSAIPFLRGVLEPYAEVVYKEGSSICAADVAEADALIVRTRTRCDSRVLGGSRCRIVATATIGTDHIDLDWCRQAGIEVANAPGCNAPAVAQWVICALAATCGADRLPGLTLGVVGVGHVGSIVARWAAEAGMRVLLCDPPRAEAEGGDCWVSLDELAQQSDAITFHTPLTRTGAYPTNHLADGHWMAALRRHPVVLNAARGGVVDEAALLRALASGTVSAAAIDCWEGEPAISPELVARAAVATPHIAGYSRPGKIRGTQMALDAVTRALGLPRLAIPEASELSAGTAAPSAASIIASYHILADTRILRADPAQFESLRNHYAHRPEPFA